VLRSILWATTGSLTRATNIASNIGRFFGWALIAFGIFQAFAGNFFGGIWIAFIGWFLSSAAEGSRQELTLREKLSHVRVSETMNTNSPSVGPDTTVANLVSNVFQRYHGRAVPVCQDDRLLGIVTVTDVKDLSRDRWEDVRVRDIMTKAPLYSVKPQDDLSTVLSLITKNDINQVLVLHEGRCAGLISRSDILSYLQMSRELGFGK
jgi:CBS domain-containing protein